MGLQTRRSSAREGLVRLLGDGGQLEGFGDQEEAAGRHEEGTRAQYRYEKGFGHGEECCRGFGTKIARRVEKVGWLANQTSWRFTERRFLQDMQGRFEPEG